MSGVGIIWSQYAFWCNTFELIEPPTAGDRKKIVLAHVSKMITGGPGRLQARRDPGAKTVRFG